MPHYHERRGSGVGYPLPLTPIWDLKSYLAFLRSTSGAPQEGQVGLQIPNRGEGERGDFSRRLFKQFSTQGIQDLLKLLFIFVCVNVSANLWSQTMNDLTLSA